jgi:hypothetical protein
MGKLFQLPSQTNAACLQITPIPTLTCFISAHRQIFNISGFGQHDSHLPDIIITQVIQDLENPAFERALWGSSEFFLYRLDKKDTEKGNIIGAALSLPNIHGDGRICWGKNAIPNDPKRAMSAFFNAPFNEDLIPPGALDAVEVKDHNLVKEIGQYIDDTIAAFETAHGPLAEMIRPIDKIEMTEESVTRAINTLAKLKLDPKIINLFCSLDEIPTPIRLGLTPQQVDLLERLSKIEAEYKRIYAEILHAATKVQDATNGIKDINGCACRVCTLATARFLQQIEISNAAAQLGQKIDYKAALLFPKRLERTEIGLMVQNWTKGIKAAKIRGYVDSSTARNKSTDLTAMIVGKVCAGAFGTFDGMFVSSIPTDLMVVPESDHKEFGKGQRCVVGFATRIANWRYKVLIGKKHYLAVADDLGNSSLIGECSEETSPPNVEKKELVDASS